MNFGPELLSRGGAQYCGCIPLLYGHHLLLEPVVKGWGLKEESLIVSLSLKLWW